MTLNPKVAAGGIAGAVSIVLVWLLNTVAAVDVPPEVAAAFTTILTFAAGFLKQPADVPAPVVTYAPPTTTTAAGATGTMTYHFSDVTDSSGATWDEPTPKKPPPVKPVKKVAKKAKP